MLDRKSVTPAGPERLPLDLISELLMGMRLFGVEYRRVRITPPFGLRFGSVPGRAQFHFVAQGTVFLRRADGTLVELSRGDAVLLPRGGAHDMISSPDLPARDVAEFDANHLCQNVSGITHCAEKICRSNDTQFFSASMEFDLGTMHALVGLMPETLVVGTLLDRYPEILPMLEAMERETRAERAGFAGILARLADVIAAFIVRGWVECGCGNAAGWVEALRDPRLGRVIAALHQDPGRDWTIAELASEMGSSRSAFIERFQQVTGVSPLRYLTELRMRLAAQLIGRDHMRIETVAQRLGYGSQAAFSRAFKRVIGHSPGAVRSGRAGLNGNGRPPAGS